MRTKYTLIAGELELLLQNLGAKGRLPTESELCLRFGCSRQTVRAALAVLEQKNLIFRRRGSGTYCAGTGESESRRLVLLLADKEEYTGPGLVREVQAAASEAGFSLSCLQTGGSRIREQAHLTSLLEAPPSGVLIEPVADLLDCYSSELISALQEKGVPVICINGRYPGVPLYVTGDDRTGAAELVRHLSGRGHRKLAAILKSDDSRGIARYQGAVRAARELGVQLEDGSVLWYAEQERRQLLSGNGALLRRFLDDYRRECTAVICFNDEIAVRLLRLIRSETAPPAVVSFDNSYLAYSCQPAITSMGLEPGAVGNAAVRLLLQGSSPQLLPWKLYARRSG